MRTLRVAMAQINPTVGDLEGNTAKIVEYIDRARSLGADLVAFPELAITGYPPEDLLFKSQFIHDNIAKMRQVVEASRGIAVVVGFVDADSEIYNAAAVAYDGELVDVYHKMHLPNYGVFDEERYFKSGTRCPVYVVGGTHIGVNVCEDIWYPAGPTLVQRSAGAEVIININGSPFRAGKRESRERMLATRAVDGEVFVVYVNLVGGQDELVFDGASVIVNPAGEVVARGSQFEEELVVADLDVEAVFRSRLRESLPRKERAGVLEGIGESSVLEVSAESTTGSDSRLSLPTGKGRTYDELGEVYAALVLGTKDYVKKVGFGQVLVAMSGGIDSSLVATVAVDALGSENVVGVAMPSRFSSEGSVLDSMALAENLGIELKTIPIEEPFSAYLEVLDQHFDGGEWGVAEENLQSRTRGNLVMALANKFGWLVLTTGNKSEMATGYATIYGDMAGGFAVIKDVPKMMVYRLAEYRNRLDGRAVIPASVIEKPPSAELRPDQKDEDSLPPYSTLDPILEAYVEEDKSFEEIVGMGYDEAVVRLVVGLVDRSEHKRRQAPPGVKITPRNFGRDRRMPIANRYKPF
jgi:NAD+ synthase (glutamine-hydrolysing)